MRFLFMAVLMLSINFHDTASAFVPWLTKKYETTVRSSKFLNPFEKEIVLELPKEFDSLKFKPGHHMFITRPKGFQFETESFIEDHIPAQYQELWRKKVPANHIYRASSSGSRKYDFSNTPSETSFIRILVTFVLPTQKGVSSYLFSLKPGDKVRLSKDQGMYRTLSKYGREKIFFGKGSGISPTYSVLNKLLENGYKSKITYISYAWNENEFIFHDEFKNLYLSHPNFNYRPTLARGKEKVEEDILNYLDSLPSLQHIDFHFEGSDEFDYFLINELRRRDVKMSRIISHRSWWGLRPY